MITSADPKDDLKYNNNVLSVKVTTTIWFVLFLSVVVGITTKLEARLFSAHNSKSFFTDSFYNARIIISTDPEDVDVLVFTRRNPTKPQRLVANDTLSRKSHFDPTKITKILIHGFSAGMYFAHRFINEYLKAGDYNVVAVDWSLLSSWDNYPVAAGNAIEVGKHVGKLFAELIREKGLDPKKIHIVGHSLGSHVAAHIGRQIQESGLGKVGRITALDPAKPWFDGSNRPQRIGKNDADFVDVIHTNSGSIIDGCYSWTEPLGHVDFYPNGGVHQPGCTEVCLLDGCSQFQLLDLAGCSHDRSISFFTSSIRSGHQMIGRKCDNWSNYEKGQCSELPEAVMGEHSHANLPEGSYFLEVHQQNVPQLIEVSS